MAFLVGPGAPGFQRLAVPAATILIIVLAYGSQWLFATSPDLEPGPLTARETQAFNKLLVCLWWSYWKACTVDPGRYEFPRPRSGKKGDDKAAAEGKGKGKETPHSSGDEYGDGEGQGQNEGGSANTQIQRRWCRKCAAPKPPRAHHCKVCQRCIPKMDHHCPWTGNCVSLQTFPHFLRFVVYTNISLWTLNYFLLQRFYALWETRHMPAYLGPTLGQLITLATLGFVSFLTTIALAIILFTTVRGWALNMTMIEGWELERHEAVLQRGGGYAEEDWWRSHAEEAEADDIAGSRGMSTVVDPVEFPYDVGIFENMAQAMGTRHPLLWILPFFANRPRIAPLPSSETAEDLIAKLSGAKKGAESLGAGWFYQENGLNDREGMWPPVDPDKVRNAQLYRRRRREEKLYQQQQQQQQGQGLYHNFNPEFADKDLSPEEAREAFRRRQEQDLRRWQQGGPTGAQIMDELEEQEHQQEQAAHNNMRPRVKEEGKKSGWVNSDGEHLGDYGVDEEAEFDDDDDDYVVYGGDVGKKDEKSQVLSSQILIDIDEEDVPLGELIRRRKSRKNDGDDT